MSNSYPTREQVLCEINNWTVNDVVAVLKKTGLADCCDAAFRRNVDGADLLNLTERKLDLWANEIRKPLLRELWQFVQNLQNDPERYCYPAYDEEPSTLEGVSDEEWDTDFEDDHEDSVGLDPTDREPSWRNADDVNEMEDESQEVSIYVNTTNAPSIAPPSSNDSSMNRIKMIAANLGPVGTKVHLELQQLTGQKPQIPRKPDMVTKKTFPPNNKPIVNSIADGTRKQPPPLMPRPPVNRESLVTVRPSVNIDGKNPIQGIVRPTGGNFQPITKPIGISRPSTIAEPKEESKLILPSNFPETKKPFEMTKPVSNTRVRVMPANPVTGYATKRFGETDSKTNDKNSEHIPSPIRPSLVNANRYNSTKTFGLSPDIAEREIHLPKPPKLSPEATPVMGHRSFNDQSTNMFPGRCTKPSPTRPIGRTAPMVDDGHYESIPDAIQNSSQYIGAPNSKRSPPPLPSKSPVIPTSQPGTLERSPEKSSYNAGSHTLPHTIPPRLTRPLPPVPRTRSDGETYTDKPWYHQVTREQADALLSKSLSQFYNGPINGQFLLRPSDSKPDSPLALVVWYGGCTYNISVRRRADNLYALGFNKVAEQTFPRVEDIVNFYKNIELTIQSKGRPIGNTRLTETPLK